jgi:hypothetical protein
MMTLGDLKEYFAISTVNESLRGSGSLMGNVAHWVLADILSASDFWWNQDKTTFRTIDGQSQYFLSPRVAGDKVWGVFDQSNDFRLERKDLNFFYAIDPTPTDGGDPTFWAYAGQEECQAVPASASTISFSSSNAADTSISVLVRGKVDGNDRYEMLTVNGTNTVTGTLTYDANVPISINLESKAAGLITFSVGATVVAELLPGRLREQRPLIQLYQVPDGAYTLEYHFYKRSLPLVSDAEVVDLPDEGFKALRYGIEELAHALNGKQAASLNAFQKYSAAKEELISWSDRGTAGIDVKGRSLENTPFVFRLPDTITGSVVA